MPTTQNVRKSYDTTRSQAWNRVDMLLELYHVAIRRVQHSIRLGQEGDPIAAHTERLQAVRTVQGIVAGLDLEQGEIPQNVARLCEFVQRSLLGSDPERHADAVRILQTLSEGFEGIRVSAKQMEEEGLIPPIARESSFSSWA